MVNCCTKSHKLIYFQLLGILKTRGDPTEQVLPGEIFVNNFQITIKLEENSCSAWKKAIKQNYKNAIIGSQKTTTNINMKVRYFYLDQTALSRNARERRA
jgi:hypothetical protein